MDRCIVLNGDYTSVSPGEIAIFIKDHGLNFDIPPPEIQKIETPLEIEIDSIQKLKKEVISRLLMKKNREATEET